MIGPSAAAHLLGRSVVMTVRDGAIVVARVGKPAPVSSGAIGG
jgi:hypothetical protein